MRRREKDRAITAVVLAAGKGLRMRSSLPKVLHTLCGMPIVYYPLSLISSLKKVKDIVAVLGYKKDLVKKEILKEFKGVKFVYQKKLNGSAKALESSLKYLKNPYILVICGDSTFLDKSVLKSVISFHLSNKNDCTVLSRETDSLQGLGRIIRDSQGRLLRIKEEIDIEGKLKGLKEINTGIYIFNKEPLFREIKNIELNPKKKEYFLTDIIELFRLNNYKVEAFKISKEESFFSVNSLKDLIEAEKVVRLYLIERLIDKGVKVVDPQTTFLGPKTFIGKNSLIYPFTFLENNVKIGSHCLIGPFTHLREGVIIKDNSQIGNFTELVRSKVFSFTKMKHFGYLGDTEVGKYVNIGAGAVVANFDGRKKNKTRISDSAFIGSDSILVAPVKVGKGAFTGAGSVVIKDVKKKTVVVGVPARKLKKRRNV